MNSYVKTPMVFDEPSGGIHTLFGMAYEDYIDTMMADAEANNREWFKEHLKSKNIICFILDDNDIDDDFCEVSDLIKEVNDVNTAMYIVGLETLSEGKYLSEDNLKRLRDIFGEYGFTEFPNVYERRIVFQRGLKI
jgi:hypothetical protein